MHLLSLLALTPTILAAPSQSLDFSKYGITPRAADPSLTGYLGTFFLGDAPSVYFYLSAGNNPLSMTPLNNGFAILNATLGTKGVRDPSLISNGGQTHYIIGTDLDISKTTWDISQRNGSRAIFIWESSDLATWTNERLVTVEDETAGMVWAPSAIWDPKESAYLVHWASKFYDNTVDPQHKGTPSPIRIRYAHTSDFITFTPPKDYIDYAPTNIIDLEFLPLGNGSYARFMKDESAKTVFMEISTTGLFGTWTRPGGLNATIHAGVEGPAPYWDNEVEGKAHLLLDFYGGEGYAPFESEDVKSGVWTPSDKAAWPKLLRHGSVLPVTAGQVEAVKATWG